MHSKSKKEVRSALACIQEARWNIEAARDREDEGLECTPESKRNTPAYELRDEQATELSSLAQMLQDMEERMEALGNGTVAEFERRREEKAESLKQFMVEEQTYMLTKQEKRKQVLNNVLRCIEEGTAVMSPIEMALAEIDVLEKVVMFAQGKQREWEEQHARWYGTFSALMIHDHSDVENFVVLDRPTVEEMH